MYVALVISDIRSTHNVGSLLRTCDGLGIEAVYMTGITPYPAGHPDDHRLPHLAKKIDTAIHKTALGAEHSVPWLYHPNTAHIITKLKKDGWTIFALEQHPSSQAIDTIEVPDKVALVVGNEVDGVPEDILVMCDQIVEIPMVGTKESFNVSVAGALGLYTLKKNWTKLN